MAISFPTSPTNGQTYQAGNKTWTYNGKGWSASSTTSTGSGSTSSTDTDTVKKLQYGLNILLGR